MKHSAVFNGKHSLSFTPTFIVSSAAISEPNQQERTDRQTDKNFFEGRFGIHNLCPV